MPLSFSQHFIIIFYCVVYNDHCYGKGSFKPPRPSEQPHLLLKGAIQLAHMPLSFLSAFNFVSSNPRHTDDYT